VIGSPPAGINRWRAGRLQAGLGAILAADTEDYFLRPKNAGLCAS